MPFGAIFGAVAFAVLCLWHGGDLLADAVAPRTVLHALWAALGVSLAGGLLLRYGWARWLGAASSALLLGVGALQTAGRGWTLDYVVLLASATVLLCLLVPATGDLRRSCTEAPARHRSARRVLAAMAAMSLASVLGIATSSVVSNAIARAGTAGRVAKDPKAGKPDPISVSSASERSASGGEPAGRAGWRRFGPGLEAAREERRSLVVEFYAAWCGTCRLMDSTTFRDPEVLRKLDEWIAVRVDAEERKRVDGHVGAELAERFAIRGYPTIVLLSPDGRELSRKMGYLDPAAFLDWLERAKGEGDVRRASRGLGAARARP